MALITRCGTFNGAKSFWESMLIERRKNPRNNKPSTINKSLRLAAHSTASWKNTHVQKNIANSYASNAYTSFSFSADSTRVSRSDNKNNTIRKIITSVFTLLFAFTVLRVGQLFFFGTMVNLMAFFSQ